MTFHIMILKFYKLSLSLSGKLIRENSFCGSLYSWSYFLLFMWQISFLEVKHLGFQKKS